MRILILVIMAVLVVSGLIFFILNYRSENNVFFWIGLIEIIAAFLLGGIGTTIHWI